MQCQPRQEEDTTYPATELYMIVNNHMGAGTQIWSSVIAVSALNQRDIAPTPPAHFNWQWGLVCFASTPSLPLCMEGETYKSPSRQYLSYCLSLLSRRYNPIVSWVFSYRFQLDMLLLTGKSLCTINVLLLFNICVSHLGYICNYIRTEYTRRSHTSSHKINPSSSWDFPWSLYYRLIFSHLTFTPSSQ